MPPTLDLVHLARQTLDDEDLARDLLVLFDGQCARLLPVILSSDDPGTRRDACHTLKGAAGAVGAAEMVELLAFAERTCGTTDERGELWTQLLVATAECRAAAARYLADRP